MNSIYPTRAKIIVGHGLGLRPTRKQIEFSKKREQYREELHRLRIQLGINIPFGANLDKLKKRK